MQKTGRVIQGSVVCKTNDETKTYHCTKCPLCGEPNGIIFFIFIYTSTPYYGVWHIRNANVVITVPADAQAPKGVRPSIGSVLTTISDEIYSLDTILLLKILNTFLLKLVISFKMVDEISWNFTATEPITDQGRWRIYVLMNWVTIGSGNGLSSVRRQAIIWPNTGILLIDPQGKKISEFESKYEDVHSGKSLSNCCLQNDGHFVSDLDVLRMASGNNHWQYGYILASGVLCHPWLEPISESLSTYV